MAISAGLAWSLANGITQEKFNENLINAYAAAQSKGLTDAQIESNMNQYGISAADVANAFRVPVSDVQSRLDAAKPTTTTEISYDGTEYTVDLTKLENKPFDETKVTPRGTFMFTLPATSTKVEFKPSRQ